MKKKTVYSELKEIIYTFDEYDIKQLILSKVKMSDSDSKQMTFAFTYKVNSDLSGAVVKIMYDKNCDERKQEKV
jgi:hypothetical protein